MAQVFDVVIRPIEDNERRSVHALMCRAFSVSDQLAFSWTPNVLVAEGDGQLLGAIILKLFALPHHRKAGSISWLFTAPEVRGQGVGQRLVEAGLDFFEQQGCDEILVTVEGFNTSSSKLFSTRGFKILSPGMQFRRYGLATFAVWAKLSHYFDLGHFIWARPAPQSSDSPTLQWWGTIIANSLIGLLMWWRLGDSIAVDPWMWWQLPPIVMLLFGVRYLGMVLMARQQGLAVRFRAWESGFMLSAAIALVFAGAMYPIPGSVYPTTTQWRYRDLLPKLGRMALAGTLPVLLILWGAWTISQLGLLSTAWLKILFLVGKPLILFDIVMPFFPFFSFNGRRLWDWHKGIWTVLATATIAVFLIGKT
ncbi:GNAT family N-acetyltransferase [Leptothoe sp. LEGE 181152]|nr:GNAT family N-acetyltransferase [Leptothoe sp. LEGE 181152]